MLDSRHPDGGAISRGVLIALALALGLSCMAQAAPRVALVIGNDRYANLPADKQLARAANDATAVAAKLKGLGFEVFLATNAGRIEMLQDLDRAAHAVDPGGSVVVYFAGHGVEIGGANFLIPSDSPAPDAASELLLTNTAVSLDTVMTELRLAGGKINVVILDACRDNPYAGDGRSLGVARGLDRVSPPRGFFVLYSAGQDQTALDRLDNDTDPNSVYTRVLLRHLTDRISLIDLAKTVQEEVSALALAAHHDQLPAYYDQLAGRPMLTGEPEPQAEARVSPPADTPAETIAKFLIANNFKREPKLASDAAGVMLYGVDMVALLEDKKPLVGDGRLFATWEGAIWIFYSQENLNKFIANPQRYAPAYGGYCAYCIAIGDVSDPDWHEYEIYDGKIYFFVNKKNHTLWLGNPDKYIRDANTQWSAMDVSKFSPIANASITSSIELAKSRIDKNGAGAKLSARNE
jgi:YHS domain-containing protein